MIRQRSYRDLGTDLIRARPHDLREAARVVRQEADGSAEYLASREHKAVTDRVWTDGWLEYIGALHQLDKALQRLADVPE